MENIEMPMTQGVSTNVATVTETPLSEGAVSGNGFDQPKSMVTNSFEDNVLFEDSVVEEGLDEVRSELSSIIDREEDLEVFDNGMPEVFEGKGNEENSEKVDDGIDENLSEESEDVVGDEVVLNDSISEDEVESFENQVEMLGKTLDTISENVERLEESSITKQELLAALLLMYELSKEKREEDKVTLFEILVMLMTKMLIELAGGDSPDSKKEPVKQKKSKSPDLDDLRKLIFKKNKSSAPVINKAA